jgi:hypothetical protein
MDKDVTIEDDGVWFAGQRLTLYSGACSSYKFQYPLTQPPHPCQFSGSGCDSHRYDGQGEAGARRNTDSCADPKAQSLTFGVALVTLRNDKLPTHVMLAITAALNLRARESSGDPVSGAH